MLAKTYPNPTLIDKCKLLEGYTVVLFKRMCWKEMNWMGTRCYKEAVKLYQEDEERYDYRMSWI